MTERVLMRTFLMLYSNDYDDERYRHMRAKSVSSEHRAFTVLSSVCWYWRQTVVGWPHSPTRHWFRHKLRKLIECE